MHNELIDRNPVLKHSFEFALQIISYCEMLENDKHYVISNQLLKCGTSIGANITEAQNAESRADFIHKMKIAAKEADETHYWLQLCKYAKNYPDCSHLLQKRNEISKLLSSILSTSKRRTPFSYVFSILQ